MKTRSISRSIRTLGLGLKQNSLKVKPSTMGIVGTGTALDHPNMEQIFGNDGRGRTVKASI